MAKDDITLEGLTKDDIKILKAFVENEGMFNAVSKVMRIGISREAGRPFSFMEENWIFGVDDMLSDAEYGAKVKVLKNAYSILNSAFVRIQALAKPQPVPSTLNDAR